MSSTQNNDTHAPVARPERSSAPDGKSKLPDVLPDFPGTHTTEPGPTNGPAAK